MSIALPDKSSLALVAALSIGCRHTSQPTEVRPDPAVIASAQPVSSASGIASSAMPVAAMCPAITAEAKRAYEVAAKKFLSGTSTSPGKTMVGWCAESPAGAWSIGMPDLTTITEPYDFVYAVEGRFSIVFTPRVGAPVRHVPKEALANYGARAFKDPWTFDFDGDGVPELWVEVHEEGEEGHHARLVDLFAFKGGAIVSYAPAATIGAHTSRDVDGDGRPDLIVHAGYTEELESCGAGFPYDAPEPRFVAHSLPDGTFSMVDAAAKSFATKTCPAPPATIGSSYDAMCARLWAKDVAKERARVVASCVAWSCTAANAGTPQKKGAAEDCERRVRFFDRKPPFTLP